MNHATDISRRARTFGTFVALSFGLMPGFAQADGPTCTFDISAISFGTVDVTNGHPYDATGEFNYACTGDARQIVRICPSLGLPKDGPRYLEDGAGHKLFFNLYTDQARTEVWGSWFSSVKAPTIDSPIGRSERMNGSTTIYARIDPGQQSAPPGIYKTSISGGNSVTMYAYTSEGRCIGSIHGSHASPALSITARVGGGPSSQPIVAPDASHSQNNPEPPRDKQDAKKRGLLQTMADNAAYQQGRQDEAARNQRQTSASRPLCKMSDADVHLVDGTWTGPNCIAVDVNGKPAHPEQVQDGSQSDDRRQRAEYLESHACMTTAGSDEAGKLVDRCNRVTATPHSGCNAQEKTCDEIKDLTRHACDGLAASAPDFCFSM